MHPFINTAIKAVREAGKIVTKGYDRLDLIKISEKNPKDFVTDIDKSSEETIIDILHTAYPTHGFLGEESGTIDGDEFQWIIDPLDGTTNFIHGLPHFSISIALRVDTTIEHAVIYDPLKQDLFIASRGEGAQKNDKRIRVSSQRSIQKCLLGTGFPFRSPEYRDKYYEMLKTIAKQSVGIRRAGSAALDLAYVASGQLDGFWEFGLGAWDIAAGSLLIREAGGLVVNPITGGDDYLQAGHVVAGNPKITKELLGVIKKYL
jgi:myo-inositol-1(or 4)-monophosphatase